MSVRPEPIPHPLWVQQSIGSARHNQRVAAGCFTVEATNLSYLNHRGGAPNARGAAPDSVRKRITDLRARAAQTAGSGASLSTIELMLNTIIEDFETDTETLAALITGNTSGGSACPPRTLVNGARVVRRLEATIKELMKVRDMLDDHKEEGSRFVGPGVMQMDAPLGH